MRIVLSSASSRSMPSTAFFMHNKRGNYCWPSSCLSSILFAWGIIVRYFSSPSTKATIYWQNKSFYVFPPAHHNITTWTTFLCALRKQWKWCERQNWISATRLEQSSRFALNRLWWHCFHFIIFALHNGIRCQIRVSVWICQRKERNWTMKFLLHSNAINIRFCRAFHYMCSHFNSSRAQSINDYTLQQNGLSPLWMGCG